MRKINIKNHLSENELQILIANEKNLIQCRRWQSIYMLLKYDITALIVADILGISKHTIYKWINIYNNAGPDGLIVKKRGGNNHKYLTFSEEEKLLSEIKDDAENGLIIIVKQITAKIEEKIGHKVGKNYVYRLLKRHGWRKIKPRPRHPKASVELQEEYKKKIPELVNITAETFPKTDTRPLKIFFQDEARFGRLGDIASCWAPEKIRPIVSSQMIREYLYLYAGVCPENGDNFSLILPRADTDMMEIFLNEFSKEYSNYRIIMILDQAGWHTTDKIEFFGNNIRMLYLPPYSPELNPAEHLWEHIRENYFKNKNWDNLDGIEGQLIKAMKALYVDKKTVQSITGFKWAILSD